MSTSPAARIAYVRPVSAPITTISIESVTASAALSREEHRPHEVVPGQQIPGRAFEPDLTLLHEHGPVGDRQRDVHRLLDDDHGDPTCLERLDGAEQLLHHDRGQSERELVDQEDL